MFILAIQATMASQSAVGNGGDFDANDDDFTDRRSMNAFKAFEWLKTIAPKRLLHHA